jgi:hypothetical protein
LSQRVHAFKALLLRKKTGAFKKHQKDHEQTFAHFH